MRDLSLHILDLAQNSVRAQASLVEIGLTLDGEGLLTLTIRDDGCGMDEALCKHVLSPFGTTRTTRKVGLGLPLMAQNARLTGGGLTLESTPGRGTLVTVTLHTGSIDCLPLGDLAGTMVTLVSANPVSPDFALACASPQGTMDFDTRALRAALDGVALSEPEITAWMLDSLQEEIKPIFGGMIL